MTLVVRAPVPGRALPMDEVADPVFAARMVGPGVALDPPRRRGAAVAPVAGTVLKLHPHAFVVATDDGAAVLVHLGIDTVQLRGAGFEVVASEGGRVEAGDVVVRWDPAAVEAGGRSPVCPVVALDAAPDALGDLVESGAVEAGAPLFTWTR